MKLVLVEWLDASSAHKWLTVEEAIEMSKPLACRTVGWLLSEKKGSDGCKLVVSTVGGEDEGTLETLVTGDITIPNVAITKMTVLRKG